MCHLMYYVCYDIVLDELDRHMPISFLNALKIKKKTQTDYKCAGYNSGI